MSAPRFVALGGGHGLSATLRALRPITTEITAVVTVADNGGSSGRLRKEFPIFPPGDLRMALAALCSDDEWGRNWAEILQYRFTSEGPLNAHAVGNLLLAALWDRDGDPVAGLDQVGSLLRTVGRVLPMASIPLDIEATFLNDGITSHVSGQVQVATAQGVLVSLSLVPENPDARSETIQAIRDAEWITIGPGSWFSSVLPHFLVPAQSKALVESTARKIVILNLDAHPSAHGDEFAGYTPMEHLEMLSSYIPQMSLNYVVVDSLGLNDFSELQARVESYGGELVVANLRDSSTSVHHDVEKLTSVLAHIIGKSLVG